MYIIHTVLVHVHTYPNTEYTPDVVKICPYKIPFFLRGNKAAHIENCPVQDMVACRFILLSFDVHDNLRDTIFHPHIKYNVKPYKPLVYLRIFRIHSDNALPVFFFFHIGQPRLHRNHTDKRLSLNIGHHVFRVHSLKLINRLYQNMRQNDFISQQAFCLIIILCVLVCCADRIFYFRIHQP